MASKQRIQYELNVFNQSQAKAGSLCVMVKTSVTISTESTNPTIIFNYDDPNIGTGDNPNFGGAGIAFFNYKNNNFDFSVNGVLYQFTVNGNAANSEASSGSWKLVIGTIIENVVSTGNAVTGDNSGAFTRNGDGTISIDSTTYDEKTILVDSLSPRDHFAIQTLNSLLTKLDIDPTTLNDSAVSHYCQQAYRYAAYMMTAAANARADMTDDTETDVTEEVEIGTLENNTDKLLNNLIAALERTDIKVGSETIQAHWYKDGEADVIGPKTSSEAASLPTSAKWKEEHGETSFYGNSGTGKDAIEDAESDGWKWMKDKKIESYSERVSNPEMNALWTDYVSHTEEPEEGSEDEPVTKKYGLYDLIKAIQDISAGGGGTTEVDFTSLIAALQGLSTDRSIIALPNVNIGDTGLGRDANNPIYISGGGFPSRQVLASAFAEAAIHDFLTFNAAGAVGYSTKAEAAKAIWSEILAEDIWSKIQIIVNNRIRAWLQAATVTINGTTYNLNVNDPT